jgi:hypothetical protein
LGKPRGGSTFEILKSLSNATHEVITFALKLKERAEYAEAA